MCSLACETEYSCGVVLDRSQDTIFRVSNKFVSRLSVHSMPHGTYARMSASMAHRPYPTSLNLARLRDVGCGLCIVLAGMRTRVQYGMLCSLSSETQLLEARTIVFDDIPSRTHQLYPVSPVSEHNAYHHTQHPSTSQELPTSRGVLGVGCALCSLTCEHEYNMASCAR